MFRWHIKKKTDTVIDSVSARGSEFRRAGPEYSRLDVNKSILGMGTLSFLAQFLK